jgi:hypothetical protein
VLKVQASPRSVYWRATTLDVYDGTRWIEQHTPLRPQLFDGRLDLAQNDPLAPSSARNPASWKKVEVEVEALADNHLVAPSVPVGYGLDFAGPKFWQGGTGTIRASCSAATGTPRGATRRRRRRVSWRLHAAATRPLCCRTSRCFRG